MSKFKNRLLNTVRDTRGTVAPMFGLMLMPMVFVIGMSIDGSRVHYVEQRAQFALDAAALAAMTSDEDDIDAVGRRFFAANFDMSDVSSSTVHVTKLDNGEVNATATVSVPMSAASLLGYNTIEAEVSSIVEPQHEVTTASSSTVSTDNTPCIHVMDQSGSYTFDIKNGKDLNAKNCIAHVRSNKSSYAMRESGGSNVEFKRIRVKGNGTYSSGLKNGASVVTNQYDVVGNPYSASVSDVIQAISVGNCTTANTGTSSAVKTWTGNVSPGTYCGNTEFKNATFGAGLYIIKSGSGSTKNGQLKFSGSINGSAGVSFYLADNKSTFVSYDVNDGSKLTAPSTGTTRGLLIFEDSNRGSTWSVSIDTCHTSSWEGLVYLPSGNVTLDIDNWPKFDVSMASNQLYLKNVEKIEWKPFAWTPFNKSTPITLDGEADSTTTTTSSTSYTDIYLKQ